MNDLMCAPVTSPASMDLPTPDKGNLWAIVLAGGEGVRLRSVTRRLYGDDRPKQYAALVGLGPSFARHSTASARGFRLSAPSS